MSDRDRAVRPRINRRATHAESHRRRLRFDGRRHAGAPGGPEEAPTGQATTIRGADNPSKAELARRERMKREG